MGGGLCKAKGINNLHAPCAGSPVVAVNLPDFSLYRSVEQLADGVMVKVIDKPVSKEVLGERFTLVEVKVIEGKYQGWRGFLETRALKRVGH